MSDFGIKTSRRGNDVLSAEPNDLVFSSKYKTLKVFASGSGSIDWTPTAMIFYTSITITHNLGYEPIVFFYYKNDKSDCNKWFQAACMAPGLPTGTPSEGFPMAGDYNVDSSTVTLSLTYYTGASSFPALTIPYKYFICIEPEQDNE